MKHFRLKFNYGVEIGAYLAYVGHMKRTGDLMVQAIAVDELIHRGELATILASVGEEPDSRINLFFKVVGNTIQFLCKISPRFALNFVARSMEAFAVYNYRKLAEEYPQHRAKLLAMAETEEDHRQYFETGS